MVKRAHAIVASIILLFPLYSCSRPSNPWTVVAVRERRPGEVPFEEASRYLWPSPDANNVPGPDSLVARVRTDENYHPFIEISSLRTGLTIGVIARAFLPHWSPNGVYLACEVWKSPEQRSELTVVDAATGKMFLDPEVQASAVDIKWSPDSRMIVADGVIYGGPQSILYAVSVPKGRVTVLDTLNVLAHYECSWSPEGRWIAFSRPTKLDHLGESTIAADIWIADSRSGRTWPLLETPDWVETNPLWITNRTIQFDRTRCEGDEPGIEQRVVIELSESDRPHD